MHYYQHNIGDYRADTSHLTLTEHGIYRQLIDWYYLEESPIPLETKVVFRRLSCRNPEETTLVISVLEEYFQKTENGWFHKRCESEISWFNDKADRARVNGRLGGRPRKPLPEREKTEVVILGNPDHNLNVTQTKANQEPITNNQQPKKTLAEHEKIVFDTSSGTFSSINGQRQVWERAYPAISIDVELAKAAAWLNANPKQSKSNYARFLTNWFCKAQDHAPRQDLLNDSQAPRKTGTDAWWLSEADTTRKAREFGLSARGGESWQDFRGRIRSAMEVRK